MRKFAEEVIAAWKERRKKKVGHYGTDGTTVYAYATPIATVALNGRRYIVADVRGDGGAHLINCLRSAFPRAVIVGRIDMYYSTIYEPTIHYPPRRAPHKIRIGKPPATLRTGGAP